MLENKMNGSKMTRNILLGITAAAALSMSSCTESERQYTEMKADSVRYVRGSHIYYFGGRGYTSGMTNSDGKEFHAAQSGKGGYFVDKGCVYSGKGGKFSYRGGFRSSGGYRGGGT